MASLASLGVLACATAACDSVLGLGKYSVVDCAVDCEAGTTPSVDSGADADATVFDGGDSGDAAETGPFDASDASDASDGDATLEAGDGGDGATLDDAPFDVVLPSDSPPDAPPLVTAWAQWPMPNPDAGAYPGAGPDAALPHPMSYDAGIEGGAPTAYDEVTHLTWYRQAIRSNVASITDAVAACASLPGGKFVVPTRIQLASLIDFTRQPTVDTTTFLGIATTDFYWTQSPARGMGVHSGYWTVSFQTGWVRNDVSFGNALLCVEGP